MRRAAFLDRDGVINQKPPEGEYVTSWEGMRFLPGVAEAIRLLLRAGFRVIVVSNQRCVAKGLISTSDLELIHQRMCEELAAAGARIDAVYYCPHENEPRCNCRKPAPGMLFTAARARNIDLKASWMIGDSDSDIAAGSRAGCRTARILKKNEMQDPRADVFAPSLLEAVRQILSRERLSAGQLEIRAGTTL